jgi:hypothetical protein
MPARLPLGLLGRHSHDDAGRAVLDPLRAVNGARKEKGPMTGPSKETGPWGQSEPVIPYNVRGPALVPARLKKEKAGA